VRDLKNLVDAGWNVDQTDFRFERFCSQKKFFQPFQALDRNECAGRKVDRQIGNTGGEHSVNLIDRPSELTKDSSGSG